MLVDNIGLLNFIGNLTSASPANKTNSTGTNDTASTNNTMSANTTDGSVTSETTGREEVAIKDIGVPGSESKTEDDTSIERNAATELTGARASTDDTVGESSSAEDKRTDAGTPSEGIQSHIRVSDSSDSSDAVEAEMPSPDGAAVMQSNSSQENVTLDSSTSNSSQPVNSTLHPCSCALVLFYSRQCPYSVEFAPQFNALARAFPNLPLLAFDMTNDTR